MSRVRGSRAPDGGRLRLVIDGPPGNLLTLDVVTALRAALADLREEGPLKLLTIEGAGPDFSFGADVAEHTQSAIGRVLPEMHHLLRDLLQAPVVTAAIVRGRCLGGGFELALACDFIFAAEDATCGLPELRLGVFPPAAAALLPARVGASRAAQAILTGESRSAQDWQAAGVVTLTAPAAALEAEVGKWFDRFLAPRSASSLRHGVQAARLALVAEVAPVLAAAERLYLERLMSTADAVEGVAAFLDKRPPHWTDS